MGNPDYCRAASGSGIMSVTGPFVAITTTPVWSFCPYVGVHI